MNKVEIPCPIEVDVTCQRCGDDLEYTLDYYDGTLHVCVAPCERCIEEEEVKYAEYDAEMRGR